MTAETLNVRAAFCKKLSWVVGFYLQIGVATEKWHGSLCCAMAGTGCLGSRTETKTGSIVILEVNRAAIATDIANAQQCRRFSILCFCAFVSFLSGRRSSVLLLWGLFCLCHFCCCWVFLIPAWHGILSMRMSDQKKAWIMSGRTLFSIRGFWLCQFNISCNAVDFR